MYGSGVAERVVGQASHGQSEVGAISEIGFQALKNVWGGRRAKNGDRSVARRRQIGPGKGAAAFAGACFAKGEEMAETGVSGQVRGVDKNRGPVREIESRAGDGSDIRFFGGFMGADNAGQGAAIGDGEGGKFQHRRAGEQFRGMGSAAEEGEVRGCLEFCVHF